MSSGHRPDVGVPGFDGNGVTIALLDTGVDLGHPYLHGHVLPGIDVLDRDSDASARANPRRPLADRAARDGAGRHPRRLERPGRPARHRAGVDDPADPGRRLAGRRRRTRARLRPKRPADRRARPRRRPERRRRRARCRARRARRSHGAVRRVHRRPGSAGRAGCARPEHARRHCRRATTAAPARRSARSPGLPARRQRWRWPRPTGARRSRGAGRPSPRARRHPRRARAAARRGRSDARSEPARRCAARDGRRAGRGVDRLLRRRAGSASSRARPSCSRRATTRRRRSSRPRAPERRPSSSTGRRFRPGSLRLSEDATAPAVVMSVGRRGRVARRATRGPRCRHLGRRRPLRREHRPRASWRLLVRGPCVRRVAEAEHRCARCRRSPPRSPARPPDQSALYGTVNGTSAAAATVAGAAALLAQMRPDLDGEGLAGLLAGYAQRGGASRPRWAAACFASAPPPSASSRRRRSPSGSESGRASTGTRRASSPFAMCRAGGSRCRRRRPPAATPKALKFKITPKDFIVRAGHARRVKVTVRAPAAADPRLVTGTIDLRAAGSHHARAVGDALPWRDREPARQRHDQRQVVRRRPTPTRRS